MFARFLEFLPCFLFCQLFLSHRFTQIYTDEFIRRKSQSVKICVHPWRKRSGIATTNKPYRVFAPYDFLTTIVPVIFG